ncbi:MAG: HU family DNA-binding protein [Chromatiales bacterium]|nr:HU family DNA-binding protein [Chromatiales bacterium]
MNSVYGQTLLDDMVQHQGLPMPLVREAAKEILAVIRSGLIRDKVVNVSNFGTFRLKPVAARSGFNPQTREPITIPAHQRVIFSPCKALRELIQPVHRPPVRINEPAQRTAARTASIAEPVATKTIVSSPPTVTTTQAVTTQPDPTETLVQKPSLDERLEQVADRIDNLNDDAVIELQADEVSGNYDPNRKYFYLGAAAAIVIAAVTLSIYFGSATNEQVTPQPVVAQAEQARVSPVAPGSSGAAIPPSTEVPAVAQKEAISEESRAAAPVTPPQDELDSSTLYNEMAAAQGETSLESATAEPVADEATSTSPAAPAVSAESVTSTDVPLRAIIPAANATSQPASFFFTERSYTIASGESLWRLARRYYGDPLLWPHIYQANAALISNPDNLRAGREITIPSLQGASGKLTKSDRRNVAQGYYLTYLYYRETGHKDAFFALLEAKRYDNKVVEEHRSLLKLSKVEEILLGQQETMPF